MSQFKDLATCEANYCGLEQANKINYNLMLWEQGKWEMIYRLVFPEQAPWDRVTLGKGVTCSRYQWEPLIERLIELLAAAGKTPAEGWGSSADPRDGLSVAFNPDSKPATPTIEDLKTAANKLVDYCEAHNWGSMPEPHDSIRDLSRLLGRTTYCHGDVRCATCGRFIACDGRHAQRQYCSDMCEIIDCQSTRHPGCPKCEVKCDAK